MSTTVQMHCDANKTEGQLQSLPIMCQLWHIVVQPSTDTQCSAIYSCVCSSVKAAFFILKFSL
jgi:hypothetical protein